MVITLSCLVVTNRCLPISHTDLPNFSPLAEIKLTIIVFILLRNHTISGLSSREYQGDIIQGEERNTNDETNLFISLPTQYSVASAKWRVTPRTASRVGLRVERVYEISLPFLEQSNRAPTPRGLWSLRTDTRNKRERPFNTRTPYFGRFKGKRLVRAATGRAALVISGAPSSTCNRIPLLSRKKFPPCTLKNKI